MSWRDFGIGLLWLGAGGMFGTAHFMLLRRTVRLTLSGSVMAQVLPLYAVRICVTVGAFWTIAQYGAIALLLALGGFLLARVLVQRYTEAD